MPKWFTNNPIHHLSQSPRSIRRNTVFLVIILCGFLLQYFLNVVLARLLSAEAYGDAAIVLKAISVAVPVILLGTSQSVFIIVPELMKHRLSSYFHGFLRWDLRIFIRACIIVATVGFLLLIVMYLLEQTPYAPKEAYHPVFFAIWLLPLAALNLFLANLMQAMNYYISSLITSYGFFAIAALFSILSLWWFDNITIYHVLIILGISYFVVIALQISTLRQELIQYVRQTKPRFTRNLWRKMSFDMMWDSLLLVGLHTLDLIMLELLGAREFEVGIFAAILVITNFLLVVSQSSEIYFLNKIRVLVKESRFKDLQHLLNDTHKFQIPLVTVTLLFVIFFGKHLLSHFNALFVLGYPELVVVAIGQAILSYFILSPSVLLYSGLDSHMLKVKLFTILLAIVMNSILIPHYQMMGAAISFICARAYLTIHTAVLVRAKFGIRALWLV